MFCLFLSGFSELSNTVLVTFVNVCVIKYVFEKPLFILRSESWDYISRGEGKPQAWEPVGHSTLTDWKKYSGILDLTVYFN